MAMTKEFAANAFASHFSKVYVQNPVIAGFDRSPILLIVAYMISHLYLRHVKILCWNADKCSYDTSINSI